MGKRATESESKVRELVPARTYLAVMIGAYDLGTQPGYQGGKREVKFVLEWELHYRGNRNRGPQVARDSEGEVLTISQFVPLKLGNQDWRSGLLKVAEAILGHPFSDEEIKAGVDIEELVEGTAQVIVKHEGSGKEARAKIDSVSKVDEDDEAPKPTSDTTYFELTDDIIRSGDIPSGVPKWLHKFIKSSSEWEAVHGKYVDEKSKGNSRPQPAPVGPPPSDGGDDDNIPF